MNDYSPTPVSLEELASNMGDIDKDLIASLLSFWLKRNIIVALESHGTISYVINEQQANNIIEESLTEDVVL